MENVLIFTHYVSKEKMEKLRNSKLKFLNNTHTITTINRRRSGELYRADIYILDTEMPTVVKRYLYLRECGRIRYRYNKPLKVANDSDVVEIKRRSYITKYREDIYGEIYAIRKMSTDLTGYMKILKYLNEPLELRAIKHGEMMRALKGEEAYE